MCFSATANFVGSGVLAYAAVASIIILAYFWKSHAIRPFAYGEAV